MLNVDGHGGGSLNVDIGVHGGESLGVGGVDGVGVGAFSSSRWEEGPSLTHLSARPLMTRLTWISIPSSQYSSFFVCKSAASIYRKEKVKEDCLIS